MLGMTMINELPERVIREQGGSCSRVPTTDVSWPLENLNTFCGTCYFSGWMSALEMIPVHSTVLGSSC
jgi:hypothetical protein